MTIADSLMRDNPKVRQQVGQLRRVTSARRASERVLKKQADDQERLIADLVAAGMPLRFLAGIVGVSHSTIDKIAKEKSSG